MRVKARSPQKLPLAWILAVGVLAWGFTPAYAVDDAGVFELDADALDDGLVAGDDWDTVNGGGGASSANTGVLADPAPGSIFTIGGSKDVNDVSDWRYKDGSVPDKDDITNAYAAAYIVDGELLVYFGADRFANDGSAQLGFWMFQDNVTLMDDGTFDGNHQIGDLLILVNYEEGGTTSSIQVLEWVGSGGDQKQGTLQLLAEGADVECGSSSLGDDPIFCAISNHGPTPAPWPYTPKAGASGTFPIASFFEAGLNVSALFEGGPVPCFASFLAETRSSNSVTAQLKDFVLGAFPVCGIEVTKTCDVLRLTEEADATDKLFLGSFSGEVTNSGSGTFEAGETIVVIDDAGTPGDDTDDIEIEIVLTGPFGPGDSVSFDSEFFTNDNPPTNTVSAAITYGDEVFYADLYSIECVGLTLSPALEVDGTCTTVLDLSGEFVVVKVLYDAEVCNKGDVPLDVTLTNETTGTVLALVTLDPDECATVTDESFYPESTVGDETAPGAATFSFDLSAEGTHPALGDTTVQALKTVTCPLCPTCPTCP